MHKLELIIFDMDGLLVDSEGFYRLGWKHAIKKSNVKVSEDTVDSWVGQGKSKTISILNELTGDMELVNKIVDDREEFIYECLHNGEMLERPYASEVLKHLKDQGYTISVGSSTHRKRGQDILAHLKLDQYIDIESYGDDVENVKPDPGVFLAALEKAEVNQGQAIVIEDSFTGAKAARNAGLRTIVVPYVDFEIDEIKKLETVVAIDKDLRIVIEYINKNKEV